MNKNLTVVLVMLFTIALSLGAQNQRTKKQNDNSNKRYEYSPAERADRLAKQLKLEDAQKMDLELYFMNLDKRQIELREKLKKEKDPEKRKAIKEAEQASNDSELRVIIGSEKMNKHIEMRENRNYRNKNGQ